jgi:hypothetical protein
VDGRTGAIDAAAMKSLLAKSLTRAWQAARSMSQSDCIVSGRWSGLWIRDDTVVTVLDENNRFRRSRSADAQQVRSMIIPRDLTMHLKAILGEDGWPFSPKPLAGRASMSRGICAMIVRSQALGRDQADKLSRALAPATIRVPWRAKNAPSIIGDKVCRCQIARKLGITENAVAKLFKRQQDLPERPKKAKSPAQIEMF